MKTNKYTVKFRQGKHCWNIWVDNKLDRQVFEMAHSLRISKTDFIKQAVKEKLERES